MKNLVVIGYGGMGGWHCQHALESDVVHLNGIWDIKKERRDLAESRGIHAYGSLQEVLDDKSVDLVTVAIPNDDHKPVVIECLEAGKNVICEKPMAINSAEAKRMLDAAKATGKKLTIGYQSRFRPDSMYLKKACEAGELGDIYYARAQAVRRRAVPTWGVFLNEYEQGGGPLIDIGTHALDLTLWMMDNYEPESVTGSSYRKLADTENAANAWGSWDPKKFTVEDSAFGYIKMKNGATIFLEASWALNTLLANEAKTLLCGTKGGADMLGEGGALRINGEKYSKLYTEIPDLKASGAAFFEGVSDNPAEVEARMWIDHVKDDSKPLITKPEQAYVVTQILEAIYKSAATGETVKF